MVINLPLFKVREYGLTSAFPKTAGGQLEIPQEEEEDKEKEKEEEEGSVWSVPHF